MPFRRGLFNGRFTGSRSTRLTAEGWLFLLFTLAVGVTAINTGNNLFYLLLAMMLSVILMSGLVAELCLRRLEFHRYLPDLLFAKEPAAVTVVIKNAKRRVPSFSLSLLDIAQGQEVDQGLFVSHLLPGSTRMLSYEMTPAARGPLKLDGLCAVTAFPFGLFAKTARYPITDAAIVCPAVTPLTDRQWDDLLAQGAEDHLPRRGCGNELYNLRLYHSGDDSRNIHWISTAKTSQLIVRETEAEDQRRATVYLVTIVPAIYELVFEEAVSFAASLVMHLSRRGYHLRLVAGSAPSMFGQGETHLATLLRMLALCERRDPDTDSKSGPDLLPAQAEAEGGAMLVVRPWEGAGGESAGSSTIVFTPDTFSRASHAIR
jgi:uncharacterized protein (DUF58 family)